MPDRPSQLPSDLRFYGAAKVTASSAITIPAQARRELGLEGAPHVFFFGSPSAGQAILTVGPEPPDLLQLLSEWQRGSRSPSAPDGQKGSPTPERQRRRRRDE